MPAKGRTVEINKTKRKKECRSERGQSEPAGTYKMPAKGRTVEINKTKRKKECRSERGQSEPAGTY